MSGGSHNYICYRIEDDLCGQMDDDELDDLMEDVAKLAHDLEWWHSGDIGEEDYRKAVAYFKAKWFGENRNKRLAEQEWIPITKRPMTEDERKEWSENLDFNINDDEAIIYCNLPDYGQRVLVYNKYSGEVGIDTYIDYDGGGYFEDNGEIDGITHWMPRPEPPKEGEGE